MVKRTRLPYATPKRNTRTGRLEWWFRRGSTWKLLPGDPGTDPKAAKLYWQRRTGKALAPKAQTIAEVIRSYRLTPKFIALKASTHRVYEYRLRYIEDSSGKVLATRISRADVIAARDANAHRPSAANQMLAVLSALMEHAIDLGWRIDNPAHGVEPLPGGPGHQPWSKGEIARFRATATGPVRTDWELCLGTGQRIGDVLRMRWDDIEGGEIYVVQEKTGAELWIPFTPDLAAHLGTLPRGARTPIVAQPDGSPVRYDTLRRRFKAAREAADCHHCTLHGLRKNATIELIEAGCSEDEIMSITGHQSPAQMRLYGKGARQRKLARQARERVK